jgi:molecular chaperone GrpE (heat shock protein)
MTKASTSQQALEQERERFQKDMEKVRELLLQRNAEDLIPMVLSDLENYYPIKELADSPNGKRATRK